MSKIISKQRSCSIYITLFVYNGSPLTCLKVLHNRQCRRARIAGSLTQCSTRHARIWTYRWNVFFTLDMIRAHILLLCEAFACEDESRVVMQTHGTDAKTIYLIWKRFSGAYKKKMVNTYRFATLDRLLCTLLMLLCGSSELRVRNKQIIDVIRTFLNWIRAHFPSPVCETVL